MVSHCSDESQCRRQYLTHKHRRSIPPLGTAARWVSQSYHQDHSTLSNKAIETEYANTDFDLKSNAPFDTLHAELEKICCVLQYTEGGDGRWYAIVEADRNDDSRDRDAAMDINSLLCALSSLSVTAKEELAACCLREFNIGFHCGDSWAYVHQIPQSVIRSVADASCSIAITLYPMRNADGTLKM